MLVNGVDADEALGGGPITVRETHISRVLMGAERVLKLKKPVDYGFLDCTTIAKRLACCEAEVRLNSRMCPESYLGVMPVQAVAGGPITDYGVLMKRLPADRMLDALVRRGEVTEAILDRAVRRLAEFHATARRGPDVDAFGSVDVVAGNWEENFQQTEPFVGRTIDRSEFERIRCEVRAWLEPHSFWPGAWRPAALSMAMGTCVARASVSSTGSAFSTVSSSTTRFRCGDTASEIAFLATDLHSLGRPDLAYVATERYARFAGDAELRVALPLYLCYRAYVRGKVLSFRLDQTGLAAAERDDAQRRATACFRLAGRFMRPFLRPAIIVVCGRSATGKTSLARGLGHEFSAGVLSTDVIRSDLLGAGKRPAGFGEGAYAPEITARVYGALLSLARQRLAAGESVVLDGTFLRESQRQPVREMAQQADAAVFFLACGLEPAEVKLRLERRRAMGESLSDANWEIYLHQDFEQLPSSSSGRWLELDMKNSIGECVAKAAAWLRSVSLAV